MGAWLGRDSAVKGIGSDQQMGRGIEHAPLSERKKGEEKQVEREVLA